MRMIVRYNHLICNRIQQLNKSSLIINPNTESLLKIDNSKTKSTIFLKTTLSARTFQTI